MSISTYCQTFSFFFKPNKFRSEVILEDWNLATRLNIIVELTSMQSGCHAKVSQQVIWWTTDPCANKLTAGSTVIQLCEKVMPLSCKHWLLCLCRALDSCGRPWIAVGSDSHWNSNWSLSASSLWLSTKPSLVKIRQRWAERKGKERNIWILSGKREK